MSRSLTLSLIVLLSASSLQAATYYAGPAGGGGCSTSRDTPGRLRDSLGCLKPGDTLYIRKGTYQVGTSMNNPPGGNANARVTIAGDPQDGKLTAQLNVGDSQSNGINISGPRYITFDNLVIEAGDAMAAGFKVTGESGYIRLQNSEVRNAGTQGILTTDNGGHNEFLNVHVYNSGHSTRFDHGFYISSSDNVVEGCEIHDNKNFGVHVYIEGKRVNRNVVRGNRIYSNGTGLLLGAGDDNMAYNNLIYKNGAGLQIRNGGSNNQGYNNTIWNNRGGDSGGSCVLNVNDNSVVRNNICYQNQTNAINGGGGNLQQSNNLYGDPKFVNADAGDFRLLPGSPAMKAGARLEQYFTNDFAKKERPAGAYDLGAYALGGTEESASNLPAPRNLREAAQ